MSVSDLFFDRSGEWRIGVYFVAAVAVLLAVAAVVVPPIVVLNARSCDRTGERLGRAAEYDVAALKCYVETDDGHMIPLENLRVTNEEGGR